jgi:fibronectin-binding autotransporter adhesin
MVKVAEVSKIIVFTVTLLIIDVATANPAGGEVTNGSATITQSGNTTTINQASPQAIIKWQSFNIKNNETTHFQQPTNGVALNRINPQQGASQIYGSLSATGKIILINSAGIHFGPSAMVNVGSLIASTSGISDANFLKNKFIFDKPSATAGAIINEGTINTADYGLVALLGAGVVNSGSITANMGSIVLGAGNKFTFDFNGDRLINFTIDEEAPTAATDQNGKKLTNGVSNTGELIADGGQVLVSARVAKNVLDKAVNMEGVAQANSVSTHDGEIILSSGEGKTVVSGKLLATSAPVKTQHKQNKPIPVIVKSTKGGKIKVLGNDVILTSTAVVDASGTNGGGNIFIGGNEHGEGVLQNAATTTVLAGASLNASALENGNGGSIIVWSNKNTYFAGSVAAQGGINGGNGGFSEISGHEHLSFTGAHINLLAAKGNNGQLLLDPHDVTVSTSASTPPTVGAGTYTPTSDNSVINVTDLENALNGGDVTITTGTTGTQTGNITVNTEIDWSNNSLTFTAAAGIILNANLNNSGSGNISFNSPVTLENTIQLTSGGAINFNSAATIDGNFDLTLQSQANTVSANVGATAPLLSLTLEDSSAGSSGTDTIGAATIHANNAIVFQNAATFTNLGGVTITSDGGNPITFGFVNDYFTNPQIFHQTIFKGTTNSISNVTNQINYYNNIEGTAGSTVNLTSTGSSNLFGNFGDSVALTSLDFENAVIFQIFAGNTFTTTGDMKFHAPLTAEPPQLTVDAGSAITFNAATLEFSNSSAIAFNSDGETPSYIFNVNVTGAVSYAPAGSTDIPITLNLNSGTLTATSANSFNNMTVNAAAGSSITMTQDQSGSSSTTINLNGDGNGTNQLIFNNGGAVDLASGIIINFSNNTGFDFTGSAPVTFDAQMSGDIFNENGTGTVVLTNSSNSFSNANLSAAQTTITQGGAVGSGGTVTLTNTILESDGNNTISQSINLASTGSTIQTSSNSGDTLEITGNVNGPGSLSLSGAGSIQFDSDIGDGPALSSISSGASTTLIINPSGSAQVSTSGDQTYSGPVTLNSSVTFNASDSSATISFPNTLSANGILLNGNSSITGTGNNFNNLEIELQSGTMNFTASPSWSNLASFTIDSGATLNLAASFTNSYSDFTNNGTVTVNSGSFTFSGGGQIDTLGSINVASGASLSIGDNINAGGTKNGAGTLTTSDMPGTNTINAGTWSITGDSSGNTALTVNSGATFDLQADNFNGTITLAGTGPGAAGATMTVNADHQIISSTITTSAFGFITVASGQTLTIGQPGSTTELNGAGTLTLGGAGAYSLAGGDTNGLANLTVSSPISIDGANFTMTTSGTQTYNALVTLVNDTTFTGNIAINQGISATSQNVTLTGSGNNTFSMAGSLAANSITVNGSGSGNSLAVKSQSGEPLSWIVNGTDTGVVFGITELVTPPLAFNNIQNITGSDNGDTFAISGGTLAGMITGGSGNNTINGDNVANTWHITSANTGSLTGVNGFTNIQNLTGGDATNNFVFNDGAAVTGTVNGTSSSGNKLDYSANTSKVTVNVTADEQGNSLNNGLSQITDFVNIQEIAANGDGTLNAAANKENTITLTGANQGTIMDPMTFTGFDVFGNTGGGTTTVAFAPGTTVVFVSPNMATIDGTTATFNGITTFTGDFTPYTPTNGGGGSGGGGSNNNNGNGASTPQVVLNNTVANIISSAINGVNVLYGPTSGQSVVALALEQRAVLMNYIDNVVYDFEFASDQLAIHYLALHPIYRCR